MLEKDQISSYTEKKLDLFFSFFFNKLSGRQTSWRPSIVMLATNQKILFNPLSQYLSKLSPADRKEPEDSGYEISNGIRLESCAPFSQQQESHERTHTLPSPRCSHIGIFDHSCRDECIASLEYGTRTILCRFYVGLKIT